MKVVFTAAALTDLDEILTYTGANYPALVGPVERRIRAVTERIRNWPESSRSVEERPGVRAVPVIRYPFRIFYRISRDKIEIVHIHHAARKLWDE
jgi:plasmid stabilization system protein ParE